MALTMSLCKECEIHTAVASLFLWLGYFNSTLNPVCKLGPAAGLHLSVKLVF